MKRVCKSGKQPQSRGGGAPVHYHKERTKWVVTDQSSEKSDESMEVHMVKKHSTQPIQVEVQINGSGYSCRSVIDFI